MLCEYGCEQKATYQLRNGKLCCNDDYRKCSSVRDKISKKLKGRKSNRKGIKMSDSQKEKISISLKGRHVSQETRNKLSDSLKGKKRSEETKFKLSEIAKKRTGEKIHFMERHIQMKPKEK